MAYPIQLILDGLKCVVVGGGKVAARKVEALCAAGADVHVVSPEFDDELLDRDDVTRHAEVYRPGLLAGARLVMICTDDRDVNAQAAADARAAGALVNVADDPEYCDFYVPAVVRRGDVQIAIGTGGASPKLAATLRRRIDRAVPEAYAQLAEELRRIRPVVIDRISDPRERGRLFARLCDDESLARLADDGQAAWRQWSEQLLAEAASRHES